MKTFHYGTFTQYDKQFIQEENVKSIAYIGETLHVALSDTIIRYENGIRSEIPGSITKLFAVGNRLYGACGNALVCIEGDAVKVLNMWDAPVRDLSVGLDGSFWVMTEKALYLKKEEKFEYIIDIPEGTTCLAAHHNEARYREKVYIGTTAGLMSMKGKRRHWAEITPGMSGVLSKNIQCLSVDTFGHLWIGTDQGMNIYDGNSFWINGRDYYAVPDGAFHALVHAVDGKKYFGTDTGAVMLEGGQIRYFSYGVWLLHPVVTQIAISDNGQIAAVTPRGISLITPKTMTLEEKAKHFDKLSERYYVRNEGYHTPRTLREYGNMDSGWLPNSDNDGLFTGLYCASQCFRYQVTGEEQALLNARRALQALLKLTRITGKAGFTARAFRYFHEENFGTENREEWHICPDNPDCEWLGETSSDEMTGHFYAYGIYYDLAANEDEKLEIADTIRTIMDHIIENNFHLVDVDGIPTTWANWEPALLNYDDRWYYERGTNSLEILSFLKTAFHVTGDSKYNEVFDTLVSKHHYAMNLMQYKCEDAHIAHIDDQLDFTNIYPLMNYTADPAQKEIFKMGLHHHWQYERIERTPWFNITYGVLTGHDCDIENAVRSLAEMNLDLVRWPLYNSYRKDIQWDTEQEAYGVPAQLKEPVEYGSRVLVHYDGNPFVCDSGAEEFINIDSNIINKTAVLPRTNDANGMKAMMPYIYLLPYWMGRYYGLIGD